MFQILFAAAGAVASAVCFLVLAILIIEEPVVALVPVFFGLMVWLFSKSPQTSLDEKDPKT